MINDIHNYARIGIVLGMAYPAANTSEEKYVEALKKLAVDEYFEVLELGKLPFPGLYDVVPAVAKAAHMDYTYSGHSRLFVTGYNPNALKEEDRIKGVEELKRGIDDCVAMGCSEFQFLSRHYEDAHIPEHIEALAKSTREVCAYASEKGLPVCMELFDYDIDKKSLLGPVDRVVPFYELVKDIPNFGFMVDCSHIPMIREPLDKNLDPIRDAITHAHIGNTYIKDPKDPAYGDLHPRFGYPGSENDTEYLAAFLQKLKDFGYLYEGGENYLSFEIRPVGDEDPDIVVANAKRTLNKAWRMVK